MSSIVVGIDASNLREGGGLTHLVEVLAATDPVLCGVNKVHVWGSRETLRLLPERSWIVQHAPQELGGGQWARASWQKNQLAPLLAEAGCDILFAPGGNYMGSFRPYVTMSRNMLPFEFREIMRNGVSPKVVRLLLLRLLQARAFRRADGLIFLTAYARSAVLNAIGKVKGAIETIPHGVSSSFSVKERVCKNVLECTAQNPFRLIYVSHVSPYKHQWSVIEAVSRLMDATGWNLRLDLVGPKSVQASVAQLERAQRRFDSAGSWCFYHGPLPKSRVQELLAAADVGVFASSCENMPNILLEKMAAGLPIVSSRMGPMPEVLKDSGTYFNPANVSSIQDALFDEIRSVEQMTLHSKAAQKCAQKYSWSRCASDTFAFLNHIATHSETHASVRYRSLVAE